MTGDFCCASIYAGRDLPKSYIVSRCGEGSDKPESEQDIYAHIGQALADGVDEPWREIQLYVDAIDNSIGLTGEYVQEGGASAHLDVRQLDHSVTKAIRQLHKMSHLSGNASWTRADFVLTPNGRFQMRLIDEGTPRPE